MAVSDFRNGKQGKMFSDREKGFLLFISSMSFSTRKLNKTKNEFHLILIFKMKQYHFIIQPREARLKPLNIIISHAMAKHHKFLTTGAFTLSPIPNVKRYK